MNASDNKIARQVQVKGRVQAVGFRPFVWRTANSLNLTGFVFNRADGVIIHIEGSVMACDSFMLRLESEAPVAAIIKSIDFKEVELLNLNEFTINKSTNSSDFVAEVCPDIAVCNDCLKELSGSNRRKNYPFINCTNCGPRFTLIKDFPYDRSLTSMKEFEMCSVCKEEYLDPADRRFHAQPICCYDCGPVYKYYVEGNETVDFSEILKLLTKKLDAGKVVAMKGLGGYNLVCDARNPEAVWSIRNFKKRDKKPFAVMFRNMAAIKEVVQINRYEEAILQSWRRPILIAKELSVHELPDLVNFGLQSLGVFLPYLPLHHLLFDKLNTHALVVTSGNESDTPIIHTETNAHFIFKNLEGGVLINNRKIERRCDDSVVKLVNTQAQLLRRARGYAPAPVDLNFSAEGILATGAELSNCFCIGKGKQAIMSQHIGDLKNIETHDFFCENIDEFSRMYGFKAKHIACDMHSDYLSTQYAKASNLPLIQVQHHHAHVAAVMAEHNLNEKVIGLAFDGTGFGSDGHIWGSEVLIADYKDFERISHFEYLPMPGGDKVTKEPWRSGLSYLIKTFPANWKEVDIPFIHSLDPTKKDAIATAISKKINSPLSCSAGRLFDAVAAMLSICTESNYHAEAPMLLEDLTSLKYSGFYPFSGNEIISFNKTIKGIVSDIKNKVTVEELATKFHNTVANAILCQTVLARKKSKLNRVVISGGTFQNKYLAEKLVHLLEEKGFEIFLPEQVPGNDAGIALGQMAIAAHKK